MLGDKFNLGSLLKNAKKMQSMMEETQNELANTEVSGESGAGAVKVLMNARHHIKTLDIDDSIISEDKSVLQDLIIAALNDANQKVEKITQAKMMDATKLFGGKSDADDA
jgi:nucleoid-associated protein EbfC